MQRTRPGRQLVVAILALAMLAVATAPAQGHVLGRATAVAKARTAAAAIARARSGETQTRYTSPVCARRNVHRFVCRTVISGKTRCDAAETTCDGLADYAIPYEIGVFFVNGHSFAVRTGARVLQ